jgi:hypothetical protein
VRKSLEMFDVMQEFLSSHPFPQGDRGKERKDQILYPSPYDRTASYYAERWVSARAAGKLQEQQLDKAQGAEELMRALADVSIVALVDEATGLQQYRARDELQKILAAYIAPELLPWAKRFPDIYYEHLHRVRGWKYELGSNARNACIGN